MQQQYITISGDICFSEENNVKSTSMLTTIKSFFLRILGERNKMSRSESAKYKFVIKKNPKSSKQLLMNIVMNQQKNAICGSSATTSASVSSRKLLDYLIEFDGSIKRSIPNRLFLTYKSSSSVCTIFLILFFFNYLQ